MRRDKRRKTAPPGPPPILVTRGAAKSYGHLVALAPLVYRDRWHRSGTTRCRCGGDCRTASGYPMFGT